MKIRKKSYLTPNEVADMLMVSPVTVRQWAQKGLLKAETTLGGHRRFMHQDVVAFAKKNGLALHISEEGVRILIVDDDKQLAGFLVELLKGSTTELETEVAHDGFEAGRKVQTFNPNIVLLDIMMPGMSGIEVCRSLKSDPLTRGIRIIAMTGFLSDDNVSSILEAGAEVCLAKPLDTVRLFKEIGIE